MQRVAVSHLRQGMVTARNVYSAGGRLLISAETTLTEGNVSKIQSLGVGSVYIKNPLFENLEVPELVKEDTRVRLVQALQQAVNEYHKEQQLNVMPLKALIKPLVSEIILNRDSMIHLLDLRAYDDYIFGHSVNVCILAVLIAVNMDYNEDKLNDLALGALLHDIGMTQVPDSILTKAEKLTQEEIGSVQRHAEDGFDVLRKVREIPTTAAHIAYQHHERFDGNGYPRKLRGDKILEFARIASVADIFDALVSDRPHRKGLLPHEAHEIMMTLGGRYVDQAVLDLFITNVAIYPVGTVVQLSSGEIAIVTRVLPRLQSRPMLRVFTDKTGALLKKPFDIALMEQLTVFVNRVLKTEEIFALTRQ